MTVYYQDERVRRVDLGLDGWIDWLREGGCVEHVSWCFTTVDQYVDEWWTWRWQHRRELILWRDDFTCRYCGEFADHVDHVYPRSAGGGDEWWNLVAACATCNLTKHAAIPEWADDWQRAQATDLAAWVEAQEDWAEVEAA